MILERKRMTAHASGEKCYGHITLDKLADPKTVQMTLQGERIIPESFDLFGHPNFTYEQEMMYSVKENEIARVNNGKFIPLEIEIIYEEKKFDVPRNLFDTVEGIKWASRNLSSLNIILDYRRMFKVAYPDEYLNEFVLFGKYWLDGFGQVLLIQETKPSSIIVSGVVEAADEFWQNNRGVSLIMEFHGGKVIPVSNSKCPCCGKKFSIKDVKNATVQFENDKAYHKECLGEYKKLTEIDKFTRLLMDCLYKKQDYNYQLLPNGYCSGSCCSSKPWFLFHTIHGDIKMGWRKRVISIEWQQDYLPFDMHELFGTEDVTKWEEDGKRGIHAWGKEKAYEYLKRVLEAVEPNYSRNK